MAVFKCKMCGGTIEKIENGIGVCEFCNTKQTISHTDEEKKMNLLDRANHFRIQSDFDKAMAIYEQILEEDTTDSDIYYSLALCKYGITYVDDLKTNKKIPTINRMQNKQFTKDPDYIMAIEKAYASQRHIYEEEGKYIDKVQSEILDITKNEKSYDVFICYKETDEYGERTKDSVLANELYYELVNEGYKVFFSKITLEGKLGIAYEPYIFAALQSSKVMVVISTKKEYANSPWVKNEWSRFLTLINEGQKKILIPAYRDMDPYDLPDEFVNFQAQDMSKLGFMQDLLRGIKKIIGGDQNPSSNSSTRVSENDKIHSLLKRVKVFIDDEEWGRAEEYCEKALDVDAENPDIYLYKFLIDLKEKSLDDIKQSDRDFRDISNNFNKLIKYSNEEKKKYYNEFNYNLMYEDACISMKNRAYDRAIGIFNKIIDYKDSKEKIKECGEKIYSDKYNEACKSMDEGDFRNAKSMFQEIIDYSDSKEKLMECKYKDANICMNNIAYETAIDKFLEIVDYKDSKEKILECKYQKACYKMHEGGLRSASEDFLKIIDYKDSKDKYNQCVYEKACDDMTLQWYDRAIDGFKEIINYKDSKEKIKKCEELILREQRKKEYSKSIGLYIRLSILIVILFFIVRVIIK